MIWDYIRDFLVQYIFGGFDSAGHQYDALIGRVVYYDDTGTLDTSEYLATKDVYYQITSSPDGYTYHLSLADWLSTTFTIIIMCMIVVFAIWLVRWVYKNVVSAFLLK